MISQSLARVIRRFFSYVLGLGISLVVGRLLGLFYGVCSRPIVTLRSIPQNWWRYAVCVDLTHAAELIPGYAAFSPSVAERVPLPDIVPVVRTFWPLTNRHLELPTWIRFLFAITMTLTLALWFLPAYLYRFSLKSTSVLLAPLAYSARRVSHGDLALRDRLDDLLVGASEQLQRWWAGLTLAVALGSIVVTALRPSWAQLFPSLDGSASPAVLSALQYLYLPTWDGVIQIKLWHIVRGANAVLLFVVYFYADKASRRLEAGVWTTKQIEYWLDSLFATQWLLSAYLWFCGLIAFWRFMHEPGFWPSVELQLLP